MSHRSHFAKIASGLLILGSIAVASAQAQTAQAAKAPVELGKAVPGAFAYCGSLSPLSVSSGTQLTDIRTGAITNVFMEWSNVTSLNERNETATWGINTGNSFSTNEGPQYTYRTSSRWVDALSLQAVYDQDGRYVTNQPGDLFNITYWINFGRQTVSTTASCTLT